MTTTATWRQRRWCGRHDNNNNYDDDNTMTTTRWQLRRRWRGRWQWHDDDDDGDDEDADDDNNNTTTMTWRRHRQRCWHAFSQCSLTGGRGHKIAFHLIPERYGQTDGRTDRQMSCHIANLLYDGWLKKRLSYITRWCNDNRCWRSGCIVLHSKPTHQWRYRHTDGWSLLHEISI